MKEKMFTQAPNSKFGTAVPGAIARRRQRLWKTKKVLKLGMAWAVGMTVPNITLIVCTVLSKLVLAIGVGPPKLALVLSFWH